MIAQSFAASTCRGARAPDSPQAAQIRCECPRVRARQPVIGLKRARFVPFRVDQPCGDPARSEACAGVRQLRPDVAASRPKLMASGTSKLCIELLSAAHV